jgi:hypothetical protein
MRPSVLALLLAALPAAAHAETKLVLNKVGVAPSLETQHITVLEGERVTLSIPVLSGNLWFRNGTPLPGANGRVLILPAATPADSGVYKVGYVGIHSMDSQQVSLTVVPKAGAPETPRLLTVSLRGRAGHGADALVAGFIVGSPSGAGLKRVLVRAVGPTLQEMGLSDVASAPALRVYDAEENLLASSSTDLAELARAQLASGAYPLKDGSTDAWMLLDLEPGSYTAQVTPGGGSPGQVLFEVWDLP